MTESCPSDKFRTGLITPSGCETIKEEVIREKFLKFLVEEKGYPLKDIEIDVPFELKTGTEVFQVKASLVIRVQDRRVILIKCGAGSVLARERSSLSLARLFTPEYQIPLTIVTNGEEATVLNTLNGETIACGLPAIPDHIRLLSTFPGLQFTPLPEKRIKLEKQILSAFEGLGLHGECK